jgi:hypothetical protein
MKRDLCKMLVSLERRSVTAVLLPATHALRRSQSAATGVLLRSRFVYFVVYQSSFPGSCLRDVILDKFVFGFSVP